MAVKTLAKFEWNTIILIQQNIENNMCKVALVAVCLAVDAIFKGMMITDPFAG